MWLSGLQLQFSFCFAGFSVRNGFQNTNMTYQQKCSDYTEILHAERGMRFGSKPCWIAFGYPAPYAVAASSLGYQTVYRTWNQSGAVSCERFFYTGQESGAAQTLESLKNVSSANAVALSLACETDLLPAVRMLRASGLAPLAANRRDSDAPVIVGGPLTLLDPKLVAPLADVVMCGEAEDALLPMAVALAETGSKSAFLSEMSGLSEVGVWVPSVHGEVLRPHRVAAGKLPAFAANWSPLADFRDLYLVEIARGCPRRCAFCLLAGTGRFRKVPRGTILEKIPAEARGVGLVGAAVTDHPELESIVADIVATDRRVSLSSMRADRLTPTLLANLVRGGLRTLTVAADGASERIRTSIQKGITAEHLLNAASLARAHKLKGLKLYSMVGLPGETDEDIEEFSELLGALSKIVRLTVAVQSFVPKPNTPLGDAQMVDVKTLKHRLSRLQRLMKGRVVMQSTSPRWSWLDWKLAHAGEKAVLAAIAADADDGDYAAWKRAIEKWI